MADKSKIEWTDSTWNPTTGCNKVSPGCKNCYALRDWGRLSQNSKTVYFGRKFEDVQTHPDRLDVPLRWMKPRRIFVNLMSDLFHEAIPFEFVSAVFGVMMATRRHTYQVLTKRPERTVEFFQWLKKSARGAAMTECEYVEDYALYHVDACHLQSDTSEWPLPNVWLGVSVEDQKRADERIPELLKVPAAVRFLSCEPLLGPIQLGVGDQFFDYGVGNAAKIHWVIAGGESGANARPTHPLWFRSLRDQCKAAGVPFHFKQHGEYLSYTWGDMSADELCEYNRAGAKMITLESDGRYLADGDDEIDASLMVRVGKKTAGRLLAGREHNEFPALEDAG